MILIRRSKLLWGWLPILTIIVACGFFFSISMTRLYSDLKTSTKTSSYDESITNYTEIAIKENDTEGHSRSQTNVAIVACSKSKEDWQSINSTTLHNLLIPSIERTVTPAEKKNVRVDLVIGFDDNDLFWNEPQNRIALQAATDIPISFISVAKQPTRSQRIPFNEICQASYEYGADFIVRVNDDSEFLTPGWISKSIEQLAQYNPPFVGVVGPTCHQGNTHILTHDFVHRTHLNIFDYYYPDEFDNWWIDDWITHVYGPKRTTKLPDWEMFHHTSKHGRRYQVNRSLVDHLKVTLKKGGKQIEDFLSSLNETKVTLREPILGTNRLAGVWGPIAE
jgi:hypothetical protein